MIDEGRGTRTKRTIEGVAKRGGGGSRRREWREKGRAENRGKNKSITPTEDNKN